MSQSGTWQAGAASVSFPVPIGTPMAGYAARIGHSTGTHDALSISALVLVTGAQRFVLIAADLIGVDGALARDIEKRAALRPGSLALCASHTHSGPDGIQNRLHPSDTLHSDARLRAAFVEASVSAVNRAKAALEPAEVAFSGGAVSGVAANRNAPDGPFDSRVRVLTARRADRSLLATLVHFACHPTILPASSNVISADFPGAVRRALGHDDFGVVLFVNGAAGDVSTRFTRQSQDAREVERVGQAIAERVQALVGAAIPLSPGIEQRSFEFPIALRDAGEIDAVIRDAEVRAAKTNESSQSGAERRIEETRRQGIAILRRLAERLGALPQTIELPYWKLGDVELFGVPGELFASLGLELTGASDRRIILGYTNGYAGYLPDRAAYEAGLYEALSSPYAPGAGEQLVAMIKRAL